MDDCPDPRSSTIEVEKSLFLLLLLLFACHLADDGRKPMSEPCIALCTAGNFCGERIIERPRIFLRRERNLLQ